MKHTHENNINFFNMENSICIMLHNLLTLNKLKHFAVKYNTIMFH